MTMLMSDAVSLSITASAAAWSKQLTSNQIHTENPLTNKLDMFTSHTLNIAGPSTDAMAETLACL
jgi:hypothetical protein